MAQLFDIRKVTVGPRNLAAVVEVAANAPLMTSDDIEGTSLVLDLMPELADHACLGDSAPRFGDVIENTELAHLLEHVTVELLARTDVAGDIPSGQTVELAERTYQLTFPCPDDVLVAGALSSAAWVLQWAYSGGGEPQPDIDAIAAGLVGLVESLDGDVEGEGAPADVPDDVPADAFDAAQPVQEELSFVEDDAAAGEAPVAWGDEEPAYAGAPASTPEDDLAPEQWPAEPDPADPTPGPADPADQQPLEDPASSEPDQPQPSARSGWDMDNVPRPRFVR